MIPVLPGSRRIRLLLCVCAASGEAALWGKGGSYRLDCMQWASEEGCALTIVVYADLSELNRRLSGNNSLVYDCLLVDPGHDVDGVIWEHFFARTAVPLILIRPSVYDYSDLAGDVLTALSDTVIYGRGKKSYRWAIRHAHNRLLYPFRTIAYGHDRNECGDLRVPDGDGPFPVCVIFHGGFWRPYCGKDMTDNLAVALVRCGFITWNVEYRTQGTTAGLPSVFTDVRNGVLFAGQLDQYAPAATDDIFVLGHSAGGQLAIYAAAALLNGSGNGVCGLQPPAFNISGCVSMAGVLDLQKALADNSGDGAVKAVMADYVPRMGEVSPMEMTIPSVPMLLAHGLKDETVPPEHSMAYHRRAMCQNTPAELLIFEGADHMDIIKTPAAEWKSVEKWLLDKVKK